MVKVYLGGVPGVGKDTVMNIYLKSNPTIRVMHFGDLMGQYLCAHTSDKPKETQKNIAKMHVLAQMSAYDEDMLLTSHYAIAVRHDDFPDIKIIDSGLSSGYEKIYYHCVLLTADQVSISERRKKDSEKGRDPRFSNVLTELEAEFRFFEQLPCLKKDIIYNYLLEEFANKLNTILNQNYWGVGR